MLGDVQKHGAEETKQAANDWPRLDDHPGLVVSASKSLAEGEQVQGFGDVLLSDGRDDAIITPFGKTRWERLWRVVALPFQSLINYGDTNHRILSTEPRNRLYLNHD